MTVLVKSLRVAVGSVFVNGDGTMDSAAILVYPGDRDLLDIGQSDRGIPGNGAGQGSVRALAAVAADRDLTSDRTVLPCVSTYRTVTVYSVGDVGASGT